MGNHQSRSSIESRALNSVCCPIYNRETIRIVRIILRSALNFLHSTRAGGWATVLRVTYIDLHTAG
eukprot:3513390-Pyramimonas_sp.AAC.1